MRRNFSTYLVIFSLLVGALAPQPAHAVNTVDLAYLGNSAKNWIKNGGAEQGRAGWVTYADTAGTTPVSCSGGSPTAGLWTVSATTPLADQYSFVWTHPASNVQGNGVAYDFTIDKAQQGKQQRVSLDYEVATGTFTAGQNAIGGASAVESDLEAYVYDKTNGALVGMTNNRLLSNGTAGQNAPFTATFQAASNSTSYRLCLHAATTVAVAHSLRLDSIRVSPQVTSTGPPVTPWTSFTPTGGWNTNTTYTGLWRRVGDDIEVQVKVALSGAPNAANLTVNLPSGLSFDSTKLVQMDTSTASFFQASASHASAGYKFYPVYNSSTSVLVAWQNAITTPSGAATNATSPFTWANGDFIVVEFKGPISGWASNVAMSSDFDGRGVSGFFTTPSGNPTTSMADVSFGTVVFDSHGAYSAPSYTITSAGRYLVTAQLDINGTITSGAGAQIQIMKNGSAIQVSQQFVPGNNELFPQVTTQLDCKAGDAIKVQGKYSGTITSPTWNTSNSFFSIVRLPVASQLAAADTVAASYQITTAISVGSSATDMIANVKLFDRTGSYNTSTGEWTCPIPGLYRYSYLFFANSAALPASDRWEGNIMKSVNGGGYVAYKALPAVYIDATRTAPLTLAGATLFDCLAGDKVKIQTDQNFGVSFTLNGGATQNYIDIERVGN